MYISARTANKKIISMPWHLFRLTYDGDINDLEFTIYKYSSERYDPSEWLFPGTEHIDGTLEGAMKAGIEAYLG